MKQPLSKSKGYFSWGRTKETESIFAPYRLRDAENDIFASSRKVLAFGTGRSYGDSCLNDAGTLITTRTMDHMLHFEATTGILTCESGVRLHEIIDVFLPRGFFIPITLGTKLITVGGAIANDVHGKNHHVAGTFGRHVLSLTILRSDGKTIHCSPTQNPELFCATIGGLGLTGLILSAEIQLLSVPGGWIESETIPFHSFGDFLELSSESHAYEHTAAWIDLLHFTDAKPRGIFFRGNFARHERALPKKKSFSIPFSMPNFLLNDPFMKLFNRLYYVRNANKPGKRIVPYDPFFFPLDNLKNWNRMYGKRGFYQYQCVVPLHDAPNAFGQIFDLLRALRAPAYLGVLKVFGDKRSPGILSFPKKGVTLSIDFPNRGEKTLRIMSDLDEIVAAAQGSVYPAKDARLSKAHFSEFFPRISEFVRHIDPAFTSDFWRRMTS